jgi:hypothetical protein
VPSLDDLKEMFARGLAAQRAVDQVLAEKTKPRMLEPGEICPWCNTCHDGPMCPPNPYWEGDKSPRAEVCDD